MAVGLVLIIGEFSTLYIYACAAKMGRNFHKRQQYNMIIYGSRTFLILIATIILFSDPFASMACPPNLTKDYRGEPDCIVSGWGCIGLEKGHCIEPKTLQKVSRISSRRAKNTQHFLCFY